MLFVIKVSKFVNYDTIFIASHLHFEEYYLTPYLEYQDLTLGVSCEM